MAVLSFVVNRISDASLAYAVIQSSKALRGGRDAAHQQSRWLVFWLLASPSLALDYIPMLPLHRCAQDRQIPLLDELRLAYLLWLMLSASSATSGPLTLWTNVVRPFLARHEPAIDDRFARIRAAFGALSRDWMQRAVCTAATHSNALLTHIQAQLVNHKVEEIKASIIDAASVTESASSVQPASVCVAPAVIQPIVEEDDSVLAAAADSDLNSALVCEEEEPSELAVGNRDQIHSSVATASAIGAVTTRRRMATAPSSTRHAARREGEWAMVAQEDQHELSANHNGSGALAPAATVLKRDALSPQTGAVVARAPFGEISNVLQSK